MCGGPVSTQRAAGLSRASRAIPRSRNSKVRLFPLAADALSDRIGFLPGRQAASRKNPMQDAVREVVVMTETGKKLRLLTNDLDAPAQEIADLYKRRWQIELFFRLMKQTLKITRFIGRSENAVRIQTAVALIAYLRLQMAQKLSKEKHGFLEMVRLIRINLMHRKDFTRLRQKQRPTQRDSRQTELCLGFTWAGQPWDKPGHDVLGLRGRRKTQTKFFPRTAVSKHEGGPALQPQLCRPRS
jgi:hypothetical protein